MNNFKIPYYIYAIFFGALLGWLVVSVIGNSFISPKPAPQPKAKVIEKKNVPIDSMVTNIIDKNVFYLDLSTGNAKETLDNGTLIDNSTLAGADGKKIEGAPPFTAELLGIIFDEEKKDGIATIKLDSGTISLSLGKTKDNITLVDIAQTFVTISKDKNRYSLILEKDVPEQVKQLQNSAPQDAEGKVAVEGSGVRINDTGSNINITVPRNELKSDLKDLNKLLESALISPFYKDDKFQGYRVAKIKEHSPLKKLGLQINDVITRINGSEISNPAVLFQMLSKIDDISAITVDMIRNDEKKSVFVEIR